MKKKLQYLRSIIVIFCLLHACYPAYAKKSALPTISKKEFWEAINDRYAKALEEKHIPASYLSQNKDNRTPLNRAILNGDVATVRVLIANGAKLDLRDKMKNSPLHTAIIANNKEIFDLLISAHLDIYIQDAQGRTPLLLAIRHNNFDFTVQLIQKGANIELGGQLFESSELHFTPLQAALFISPKIATYLIDHGANLYEKGKINRYPIVAAVLYKRDELVDVMLAKQVPLAQKEGEFTVLHAASLRYASTSPYLQRYIDAIPINQKDDQGNTALHYAVSCNTPDIVTLLLDKGADVHLTNHDNETPLHKLMQFPNDERAVCNASLLVSKGADCNASDNQSTLLGYAVCSGELGWVRFLLDRGGADINQLPINPSWQKNSLIKKVFGTTIQMINPKTTLLHLAICKHQTEIAQFLLERNPSFVNERDSAGCTPMHYAALLNNIDIAHALLNHGARLDIRDKEKGLNPIQFAEKIEVVNNDKNDTTLSKYCNEVIPMLKAWQKEQKKKARLERKARKEKK